MRPTSRLRVSLAAAAVPVLLLAGGCSGDATGGNDAAAANESTEPASQEESASPDEPSEEPTPSDSAESDPTDATSAEGSWDQETLLPAMKDAMDGQDSARFTMEMVGGGSTLEAEGALSFESPQQDMVMTMDGGGFGAESVELRRVDGVVYLSMPPMTPQGKFMEMRPGDPRSGGMLDALPGVDPRDTFDAFDEGLREVEYVGEESVEGESLEHYRLSVDTRAATKAQGMPGGAAGMPRTVDYDMWLDDQALMRRMEFAMEPVTLVMEMSDWGAPVSVVAPQRKDIVEPPGH